MKLVAGMIVVLVSAPIGAYAQESLVGRYGGHFTVSSPFPGKGDRTVQVELVIASAENGVVSGTGKSSSPSCRGAEMPIEGKQDGNKLEIRAVEQGRPCTMQYALTIEGKKLVGTTRSGYPVQLTKQ